MSGGSTNDLLYFTMNVRESDKQKGYGIPQNDILEGVNKCEQGDYSSANLAYQDTPKAYGKPTC